MLDTFAVNTQKSPEILLQEIAQIQRMERGKLSVLRESDAGAFYKLQTWENHKNVTRYVPRDQVQTVKEAIAGFERFEKLTAEYSEQIVERTRAEIQSGSKKKMWPKSSSLKARKSNK